jgi:hypothetical protein
MAMYTAGTIVASDRGSSLRACQVFHRVTRSLKVEPCTRFCPLPRLPAMLAAALITYRCTRPENSPWPPGVFTVKLIATAGPACCRGEGQAVATVTFIDKPTVTILAPTAPVTICEDSQEPFVEVEFTVQSDTADAITLPTNIAPANRGSTTTGRRDCVAQGLNGLPLDNCEADGCCAKAELCS